MTYVRRKVDANQPAIVAGLRQCGARVLHLHTLGHGAPDLLCGFRGQLHLIEIKEPGKRGHLTDDEFTFHQDWHGYPVHVCETLHQALAAIGAIEQERDR